MIAPRPHLHPGEEGRCWRRAERRIRAVEPRRHCEWAAYHVIEGQMRYLVDDRVCHAGPRTLLWVNPAHSHILLSETPDFDMWCFVFADTLRPSGEGAPDLLSRLSPERHEELCQIASTAAGAANATACLRGIAYWGERAWAAASEGESSALAHSNPAARRAAEYLAADPAMGGAELAARIGLSADRIARLFRAETGERLGDYRNRCRLAAVDRLMAQSRRGNLLSCALEAGFGSYAQFYRVFCTLRGASPREYYAVLDT